jgi:predicted GNAT superfamily acetyltransferase
VNRFGPEWQTSESLSRRSPPDLEEVSKNSPSRRYSISKTNISGNQREVLGELIKRGYLVISVTERIEIITPHLELILFNRLYQRSSS